ncbi:hypothetical protein AV530_015384 [Patagioenas fasciata monilis]|uniref:Uncharacterized protein n=1 Tax=Patagioenas fasciata monilis TaxID=372326 RepID=A0A1V4JV93_PATFA|nr:hypothetical protein AV530_015384 [Patagioenas fasciata monilis]
MIKRCKETWPTRRAYLMLRDLTSPMRMTKLWADASLILGYWHHRMPGVLRDTPSSSSHQMALSLQLPVAREHQEESLGATADRRTPLDTAGDCRRPQDTTEDHRTLLETVGDRRTPLETIEQHQRPLDSPGAPPRLLGPEVAFFPSEVEESSGGGCP